MGEDGVISRLIAQAGAGVGLLQTYAVPFRYNRGPEGRWWEPLRRAGSLLGGAVDERAGPRAITDGEYAGRLEECPPVAEWRLWRAGLVRNPFSRLKTRDGEPEAGSWAYRQSPTAERQVHLMLFARKDGNTDVYAHEEPSSVNPLLGYEHINGRNQNVRRGVEWARAHLPLVNTGAGSEPPDGPWDTV